MKERGFTLVELVAVLVIVGVLAVYAAPYFNRGDYEVTAARDELMEALRYAQEMSMTHTGAYPYRVEVLNNGYQVTQQGNAIANPLTGTAPYQQTWTAITVSPAATITFDGRGRPDSVALTTFTITGNGDSLRVTLEPITGYIH